jgi:hypothetical protein
MGEGGVEGETWTDWPDKFDKGGLLFHGDNKDVLAHLLANGFRGKVKLIYIDPPFDSGADYVRKVQLRGQGGSTKIEGEKHTFNVDSVRDSNSEDYIAKFKYEDEVGKYQIRGKNIPDSPVRQADGLTPEAEELYRGLTYRQYFHEEGQLPVDWWKIPYDSSDDLTGNLWEIPLLNKATSERMGYPTQKPERLVE